MIEGIKKIFRTNRNTHIQRIFEPKIFIDSHLQTHFETYGYVHLKGVIQQLYIQQFLEIYHESIHKYDYYSVKNNFLNTMALRDSNAKHYIKNESSPVIKNALAEILDMNCLEIPFGAAYCINPPNAINSCKPHQDPAYVDETRTYSVIAWIPLEDIQKDNGCLHILPKSHLWGNDKRSISMDWAFEKFSLEFWNYLQPIITQKGDIVIFDAALIHGTNINTTNKNRVAINIPLLPRNEQMITFTATSKNLGNKYEIDADYYLEEYLFETPSERYKQLDNIKLDNIFSKKEFYNLIKKYQ